MLHLNKYKADSSKAVEYVAAGYWTKSYAVYYVSCRSAAVSLLQAMLCYSASPVVNIIKHSWTTSVHPQIVRLSFMSKYKIY